MNKTYLIALLLISLVVTANLSFKSHGNNRYTKLYHSRINEFSQSEIELMSLVSRENIQTENGRNAIRHKIDECRLKLKGIDLWLRYLDPLTYHKINGPLPVEWETEVFEKFEPPYRREGAGLSLAALYLDEKNIEKDSLLHLVQSSQQSTKIYFADSITVNLDKPDHFYLANRLFLLNLAAIYTTGFECPEPRNIIPELGSMLESVQQVYTAFNESFPASPIKKEYLELYMNAMAFAKHQPTNFNEFDHYNFIKNYVNPLFGLNQKMIRDYGLVSNNFNDFSLDDNAVSIFDKSMYKGQNAKGVYIAVDDEATLAEIRSVGKLLFYDPILSGNNKRSCASCHKPTEYFTDTGRFTSLQFETAQSLLRNTPSLINVVYNHLLMLDGKHTSLINQAKDVVGNPIEMSGGDEKTVLKKVLSCDEYAKAFKRFVKLTPNSKKINIDHIVSAVIVYYSSFSKFYSAFDDAMNENKSISSNCEKGFNIFMSKAQCATCHFVPQFNGTRPPYISTEFEVLGVPADTAFSKISPDSGRSRINPASQTMNAFRTGSIRNAEHTKPYMHNGVFNSLEEVINFYDAGGGVGKGLKISNQTLSTDSLKLSKTEKEQLTAFLRSLNENIKFENPPSALPASKNKNLNGRKVGGEY
ncbi:MAG: cytochrome c peroxidase [Ferruginibacter sp.]